MFILLWLGWLLLALCASPVAGIGSSQATVSLRDNADVQPDPIKHVHIVFSNHLDVGFTAAGEVGLDNNVINKYFREYFPRAAATAAALRAYANNTERFVYTTHSWLVNLYLDCPARLGVACPSATEVASFRAAVDAGDISWHAMPHNAQTELYDWDLLDFAVRSTHALDQAFGQREKITMSQRDVPGLTRTAIPALAGQGVKVLSVGVNGCSAPPGVPFHTPFVWRDEPSGTQLLAFWHPGGYSGWPVDSREECVTAPGFDRALCCAWHGDNDGPHSTLEVLDIFSRVRKQFPGAEVTAGNFEEFSGALVDAAPSLQLPVVTGEIGDTWIHGVASDPGKVAEYRALLRMRRASREHWDDPAFTRFSTLLLKVPEHTWGVDIKDVLRDYDNWRNEDFHAQLANGNPAYTTTLLAWHRQRAYLRWAVEELGDSPAGLAARQALAEVQHLRRPLPARSEGGGLSASNGQPFTQSDLGKPLVFESDSWRLQLDPETGALTRLQRVPGNTAADEEPLSWATPGWPLAQVVYSTYSESDFHVFWDQYAWSLPGGSVMDWYYRDFGKPGATTKGNATRADYLPTVDSVHWRRTAADGLHVVVRSSFPAAAVREAGAPESLAVEIRSPPGSDQLLLEVGWEGKTPTRLPEALWVAWRPPPAAAPSDGGLAARAAGRSAARLPARLAASSAAMQGAGGGQPWDSGAAGSAGAVVDPSSWQLYKIGRPISPLEVILNGSHALHAVSDEGVTVTAAARPPAARHPGKPARALPSSALRQATAAGMDGGQAAGAGGQDALQGAAVPRLRIQSLDAVLVSPGQPTPFPVLDRQPDLRQGVSFCLTNNIWGTNYIMWQPYQQGDHTMRFRFVVQQEEAAQQAQQAQQAGNRQQQDQ